MRFLTRNRNTTLPATLPRNSTAPPSGGCESKTTDPWDYGFKRLVPFVQSPPFGAGILAITLFVFIVIFPDLLLAKINLATLGITVTIGTFGILALILFILFLF